ncbi:MAG: hypothetical protein JSV03_13300 [Planctomycetota bacterium]|nr:MAG: hypothetical protein JSV03_13300 [Planctomycetota bacterium]
MSQGLDKDGIETSTIVGIDEAGYGPLLGPMVVSAVAFDVPIAVLKEVKSAAEGPDLWALLRASITRKVGKRDPRLAVVDSKKLYGRGGIGLLERAALSFCWQITRPGGSRQDGNSPGSLRALLDMVCPRVINQLQDYPWYIDGDVELPVKCSHDDMTTQHNALSTDLSATGIQFRGVWVEVLPAGQFNRLVEATRNKAVVLFGQCSRLIQQIADAVGPRPLRIWVDRHGGRIRYHRQLMNAFEGARLDILEESPDRSSYRLTHPDTPRMIRFVRNGEEHHLPVALASIFSKYIRELFMVCFNRYWTHHVPGLRPTAGYYQDGLRFLEDIGAVINRQHVDRQWLVRNI